jgi:hypothetical protein
LEWLRNVPEARVEQLVPAVSLNLNGREATVRAIRLLGPEDAGRYLGHTPAPEVWRKHYAPVTACERFAHVDLVLCNESLFLEARVNGSLGSSRHLPIGAVPPGQSLNVSMAAWFSARRLPSSQNQRRRLRLLLRNCQMRRAVHYNRVVSREAFQVERVCSRG